MDQANRETSCLVHILASLLSKGLKRRKKSIMDIRKGLKIAYFKTMKKTITLLTAITSSHFSSFNNLMASMKIFLTVSALFLKLEITVSTLT